VVFLRSLFLIIILNCSFPGAIFADYDSIFLKNYLKSLKSVQMEFEQIVDNVPSKGILLLQKPYNFRCHYSEGSPLLITGNSKFVHVYDYDLDEISNISRKDNMLRFIILNDEEVDQLNIVQTIDNSDSVEFVSIDEDNNEIIIKLSKLPLKLKRISINSFNGSNFIINFGNIKEVKVVDNSLFSIKNPKIFGPPKKLFDFQ